MSIIRPTLTTIATSADAPVVSRRLFLGGAAATLILAPAIVRASSLMDIRGVPMKSPAEFFPCDGSRLPIGHELFKNLGHRYDGLSGRRSYDPETASWISEPHPQFASHFMLPNFNEDGFGGLPVNYELNRQAEIFMSLADPSDADRLRGGAFTADQIEALKKGERVKI